MQFEREGPILGKGTYGRVRLVKITGGDVDHGAWKEMYYDYTLSGFGNIREIEILLRLSKRSKFIPRVILVDINRYVYKPPMVANEPQRTEFMSFICEAAECDGATFFSEMNYSTVGNRRTNYTIDHALRMSSQLLMAVDHMHCHRIYHRDIKPGNVLIYRESDGTPLLKVTDFGFAKWNANSCKKSPKINTDWYRAPEVLWRLTNYKMTTDVWCIGCTIYEMLTGVPLMRDIQNEEDPGKIFEKYLRIVPNEWTTELQTVYRNKSSHYADMKIFGKASVRKIKTSPRSFMEHFASSPLYQSDPNPEFWKSMDAFLLECLSFSYRERKDPRGLLDAQYFSPLREYVSQELASQRSELHEDGIRISVPEAFQTTKCEYFREAYRKFRSTVKIRSFFHAIDLANRIFESFPDSESDPNTVCGACLYFYNKYFSIVLLPENPMDFFFRSFSGDELETPAAHENIDRFVYNFEKKVIKAFLKPTIYRNGLFEAQDQYEYLSTEQLEKFLFDFCDLQLWDYRRSFRYMYRQFFRKHVDPTFPLD